MGPPPPPVDDRPTVLLVDDDPTFCDVLARGLSRRAFDVRIARSAEDALRLIDGDPPEYVVLDLKLPDSNGLALIAMLRASDPHTRIVVLTGYASVPTAVEAIKLGATHYLAKPVNIDDLVAAFHRDSGDDTMGEGSRPMSLSRLEWEHIQRVLHQHRGNVSATARALSMHRRTLQRKLAKRPVAH